MKKVGGRGPGRGVRVDVYKELIEVIVKMKKVRGGRGPIGSWELVGGGGGGGGGNKVGGSG